MVVVWNINKTNMSWSSFKFILLSSLVITLFNFPTTEAIESHGYLHQFCFGQTTLNSPFEKNQRTLFSSLSSKATTKTFYDNTVVGRNSSDTVYGMFMCRGDIPSCGNCVLNATNIRYSDPECSLAKQGVIWFEECMLRYSNVSFFSKVATRPFGYEWNSANISSNSTTFMSLLYDSMNQTAHEAANSVNRYSTKETNISELQTLYCLAQCTQDLSPQNCRYCLNQTMGYLPDCCDGKIGGKVVSMSCNIRYELYPFYRVRDEAPPEALVPETKYPKRDLEYSEDPGYMSHNCSRNKNTKDIATFQADLNTLLSNLSSNAISGNRNSKQAAAGTLHGFFTCRGDLSHTLCGQCVQNATEKIVSECGLAMEGVIWYNHCWLRYSNRSLALETSPSYVNLNVTDTNPVKHSVAYKLSNELGTMADTMNNNIDKYQTGTLTLNNEQTVYILAQCAMDLSSVDCSGCLNHIIGSKIPWTRLGSVGGRVMYPSCILRFEFFQFYSLIPTAVTTTPPLTPPSGFILYICAFSVFCDFHNHDCLSALKIDKSVKNSISRTYPVTSKLKNSTPSNFHEASSKSMNDKGSFHTPRSHLPSPTIEASSTYH